MTPVDNSVIGQIFQYAGYISVTIASIIGVIYMLRPKPDFRELAADIRKSVTELVKANTEAHEGLRIDQALQRTRMDSLTERITHIEGNCQSEKTLIREVETRLHNRIDAVATGLSNINGHLSGTADQIRIIHGQLKNIMSHLLRKENS